MPITPAKAFNKRAVMRPDGVEVLSRPLVTVAAIEAGYTIPTPMVDEDVANARYPGCLTAEEFNNLCERNSGSQISLEAMASAILMVAPDNCITRASLEAILEESSNDKFTLTAEEIDLLFDNIDTNRNSKITADDLMKALFGAKGVQALDEERLFVAQNGMCKKSYNEQKAKEEERVAKEEEVRKKKEQEKKAQEERERVEREKKVAAEKAAAEKAARETKEKAAEKEKKAEGGCC